MPEDERRKPKLPRNIAEDNLVLGQPRSKKGRAARRRRQPPRASQEKGQVQWDSHGSMVEEQFKEKLSHPH